MPPPLVKICCIASVEEARLAQALGAAALGLVSAMPSGPGVVGDAVIAQVAAAMQAQTGATGRAPPQTFLLTARTRAIDIAAQHAAAGTTTLQLVDEVPVPELQRLRQLCTGVRSSGTLDAGLLSAFMAAVASCATGWPVAQGLAPPR